MLIGRGRDRGDRGEGGVSTTPSDSEGEKRGREEGTEGDEKREGEKGSVRERKREGERGGR